MNILISSAGRQTFLVKEFKNALRKKGMVIVTDYNESAEAFKVADKHYTGPAYEDENYIPWLLNICRKENIALLLTLNVDELLHLEENRKSFELINCFLIGGELEIIKATYDKYLLYEFCNKIDIETPPTYLLEEIAVDVNIQYPVIAKPRKGKGSRGNFIIHNKKQLNKKLEENKELFSDNSYIFQEMIGGDEFGIDLINDFESNFKAVFVRKKLEMKNGETFEAISSSPDQWTNLAKILSRTLRHQGIIDLDFMVLNGKKYLIDINHRFGGGYVFSHTAGAELPKVFVNWFLKKNIKSQWLTPKIDVHCRRGNDGAETISDGK